MRNWRWLQQRLITGIVGEYAKSILANMEYANNAEMFVLCEVVSEYVKSILAHMEKKSKENKSTQFK
jgi:hypothetical protein